MMTPDAYTLGRWQVRPGREADFVSEWKRLGAVFAALPGPPLWGSLVRSEADPTLYYSFGPWRSMEDIAAMRASPAAQAALRALRELCVEATPGTFRLVEHVEL